MQRLQIKSSLGNDYVRNINKAIHGNTNAGYSVISWAKAVDATVNDDIGLIKHNSEYVGGDGVHLTRRVTKISRYRYQCPNK